MTSTVRQAPRFSERDARRLARELYAVRAAARELPSERDQNFHLVADSGGQYVLKIANAAERAEILELQNGALEHVARSAVFAGRGAAGPSRSPCPRVIDDVRGRPIASTASAAGATHLVRLLSWLPGRPLARVRPHDAELLGSLGRLLGTLDRALEGFEHPAAHREFHWDLQRGAEVVGRHARGIADPALRAIVERRLERFARDTAPALGRLRRSVIHNDANDHNVLVEPHETWRRRATGLIDFGDMVHAYTVGEAAVGAAYAMLGKADPLAAARHVVAGYHEAYPLTEPEVAALYPLIGMRLCMSACIAAEQQRQAPDNAYLGISQRQVRELLVALDDVHPSLAHYHLRQACGMEPCPGSPAVRAWLRGHRDRVAPVVRADLGGADALVLDLGVDSPRIGPGTAPDIPALTRSIFGAIEEAGARVGVGRYDETRHQYAGDRFAGTGDEFPERRTVHLGIDLFMSAGEPVFAALDGEVHGFGDNDAPFDYGPTVILRHATGAGDPFYTLYGHLGRDSLDGLREGAPVRRGQRIGRIGATAENGGWPPHLHFQVVTDLLGHRQDFPGVGAPGQRPVWRSLCPDPNLILGIPAERFPRARPGRDAILAARRRHFAGNLSLAYRAPLHIVRGAMQFLFDEDARAYLDAVNNVAHVGHCHPRVVAAGQQQMAVLNTNTRYLHELRAEYARRLCETFPDPLSVCFLVCSGSEANELALRLARAHTGRRDVIVVEGGYHGNTQGLIDVSPYKFGGPGGAGAPAGVHVVPLPDPYRGPHRGGGPETGARYAAAVGETIERLRRAGDAPAAFLCESLPGCAGQIVLPEGYLAGAYRHVRAAGGVCIADEVQVGFGRVGTHRWGFETQGVVPDIVTLGKPIGNGHPLAAVITTPAIADSFASTGMEYFNSFGGNPVSCAVGLAVLDVMRDERLQQRALDVGARLKAGLRELLPRHPRVGDVRGLGLFLGVELVLDRESREPAPEHAAHAVERMKDHGILIGTDGPRRNVLKIKPPLVFDERDADRLAGALDRILGEDALQV